MLYYEPFEPNFTKEIIQRLVTIGHPTRLRVLQFFDAYGQKNAREIRIKTGIKYQYVTQALCHLCRYKFVMMERKDQHILYALHDPLITDILFYLRKVFGYASNDMRYVVDPDYKTLLPKEFSAMLARQIKVFANYERFKLLEYLWIYGQTPFSTLVDVIGRSQSVTLYHLLELKEECMIARILDNKVPSFKILDGVYKHIIQGLHQKYDS